LCVVAQPGQDRNGVSWDAAGGEVAVRADEQGGVQSVGDADSEIAALAVVDLARRYFGHR
jgi:hypothetical protein